MTSILFRNPADRIPDKQLAEPDCFTDLNLDQIVGSITADKEEYNLTTFFNMPLQNADAVAYRHEVMQDLENSKLFNNIKAFGKSMRSVRENLAETKKDYYPHQKKRWFLDAINIYGTAVTKLADDLSATTIESRGLKALKKYLDKYVASEQFTALIKQAEQLEAELSAIRYEVLIEGLRVEIRSYHNEPNYSKEIRAIFERFSQGSARQYDYGFRDEPEMNQVEGRILDLVGQLYRDIFSKLTAYLEANQNFLDSTVALFDREVQFYIAYLEHIAKFKNTKLNFCYPQVSETDKDEVVVESFDLALAEKLASSSAPVTNGFYLHGPERIIVVSGPNQGGKTTFARTFGQLHYLASLGCLVPGARAQLYLPDRILTHFEREEKMTSLRGKLEDDLIRMHDILQQATPRSIIIINEIFTSTALQDAISLSRKVGETIMKLDLLGVWVTFIDEVASLTDKTVSMVSTVKPNQPAVRTFKILRRPADGLAYALSIAEKYRLTQDMIRKRIKP